MAQEMATLPLAGGTANKTSDLVSKGLWARLTSSSDWRTEAWEICRTPALRDEVESALPALVDRARPIGAERLALALGKQLLLFGLADATPEVNAERFAPYFPSLKDFCQEAIDEAWAAWHRGDLYPKDPGRCAFYPKPAELHALALPVHAKIAGAAYRARKAVEKANDMPKPRKTPEEMAAMRAQLIAEGILNPDGSVNLTKPKGIPPASGPKGESPQEMAARIRNATPPEEIEEAV